MMFVGGGDTALFPMAGLWGWWDAADAATITHVAGAVSQWNDKSGGNRHLVQTNASWKPTTGTRTQNSLNCLDFDGGDILAITGAIGLGLQNFSWAMVFGEDTAGTTAGALTVHNGSGNDYDTPNAFTVETGSSTQRIDFAHNNTFNVFTTPGGTPTQMDVYMGAKNSGTNQTNLHTKNPVASQNTACTSNGTANGGVVVGGRFSGGAVAAGNRLDGRVCELLIYSTLWSSGNRLLIEAYLATKWGL